MRLLVLVLLLLLASCAVPPANLVAPVAQQPAASVPPALNDIQATAAAMQAAQATQEAEATRQAEATQQAYRDRALDETAQAAQATSRAGSDQATSTANVRVTWDAATSTAGALMLQSTQAHADGMATSTALAQEIAAAQSTQAAMLDRSLWHSHATATAAANETAARADEMRTNVIWGGAGACLVLVALLCFAAITITIRGISHRMVMAELQLQAAAQMAPLLSAKATPVPNVTAWKQSTLKSHALRWIGDSVKAHGEDANQLIGWQGKVSDQVRTALQSAGLVEVQAGTGTFSLGNLDWLKDETDRLDDNLLPYPTRGSA